MTSDLVTVQPNSPLVQLREVFAKHSFHHLPVVGPGNELVGIISREDFFKVAYVLSVESQRGGSAKSRIQGLHAEDIMTRYPLQLAPDDTIGLAADIFLANKFHALPITEDGELVGIVTSHDLLAHCFESPLADEVGMERYQER